MIKKNYEDILPEVDSWLLSRENGMLLSDRHVRVLEKNNIDYLRFRDLKELLFTLNEITDADDELEEIALDLAQIDYYSK